MVKGFKPSDADLRLDSAEERSRFPGKHRTHDHMNRTGPTMFLIGDNISGDVTVEGRHGRDFIRDDRECEDEDEKEKKGLSFACGF